MIGDRLKMKEYNHVDQHPPGAIYYY